MDSIEKILAIWKDSLVQNIPVGGLISRIPVVYKWESPFRCWVVREAAL